MMLFVLSIVLAALSLCLLCYVLLSPGIRDTVDDETVYFKRLAWLWPWVNSISSLLMPFLTWPYKKQLEARIEYAGFKGYITINDIVGLQGIAGILTAMMVYFVVIPVVDDMFFQLGILFFAVLLGAALPQYFLSKKIQQRQQEILKTFPFFLDMTTLCVESGANFHGALLIASQAIPDGTLRFELRHALSDMRAGVPRIDALRQMAERADSTELKQWVASIAQAETLGASLGPSLRAQSDQYRQERFLRAEKLAQKAPVKLLFPLVLFILPCTFIVILYPLFARIVLFGFH